MAAPRQMVQHNWQPARERVSKPFPRSTSSNNYECTRMRVRCVRVTSRLKRIDDSDDVE
jgi:hypothetical protein